MPRRATSFGGARLVPARALVLGPDLALRDAPFGAIAMRLCQCMASGFKQRRVRRHDGAEPRGILAGDLTAGEVIVKLPGPAAIRLAYPSRHAPCKYGCGCPRSSPKSLISFW